MIHTPVNPLDREGCSVVGGKHFGALCAVRRNNKYGGAEQTEQTERSYAVITSSSLDHLLY